MTTLEGPPAEGQPLNLQLAQAFIDEASAHMQELSKGLWKPEFSDIVDLMVKIATLRELTAIKSELMFANHEARMNANPLSMMNMRENTEL